MYYNGYIIICIFIGAYLGSFVFQWEPIGRRVPYFRSFRCMISSRANSRFAADPRPQPPVRQPCVVVEPKSFEGQGKR